jgi:hypothetical protein
MIDPRARPAAVVLLATALVLGGCAKGSGGATPSGAATSSSATSSTTTAEGGVDALSGRTGTFSVMPPEGWSDATDKAKGVANIDLVVLSSKKVARFSNNVVVLTSKGDQSVLEGELEKGRADMEAAGRTISPAPERTIGGVPASGFTTTFEQDGVKVLARSYGLTRGGRVYLLTLSSSPDDADHAMREFDELIASWNWT